MFSLAWERGVIAQKKKLPYMFRRRQIAVSTSRSFSQRQLQALLVVSCYEGACAAPCKRRSFYRRLYPVNTCPKPQHPKSQKSCRSRLSIPRQSFQKDFNREQAAFAVPSVPC